VYVALVSTNSITVTAWRAPLVELAAETFPPLTMGRVADRFQPDRRSFASDLRLS
jgi:hypothetical protein